MTYAAIVRPLAPTVRQSRTDLYVKPRAQWTRYAARLRSTTITTCSSAVTAFPVDAHQHIRPEPQTIMSPSRF